MCYDEFTGKKTLNDSEVLESVHPTTMIQKGNYAIAITWSDGHNSSIYPYKKIFKEFPLKNN